MKKSKHTPSVNNAGQRRKQLNPAGILKQQRYTFQLPILAAVLGPEALRDMVREYYVRVKDRRSWAPSKRDMKVFAKFNQGKVDIEGFKRLLFIKSDITAYQRLGKIIDFQRKSAQSGSFQTKRGKAS